MTPIPRSMRLAALLAVLPWFGGQAQGQSLELLHESNTVVVTGGSERSWRLRYGLLISPAPETRVLSVSATRGYFANGPWLRLIDIEQGAVLGRWRFPDQIIRITPGARGGLAVDVAFRMPVWAATAEHVLPLDPSDPPAPTWEAGSWSAIRVAPHEALGFRSAWATDEWTKTWVLDRDERALLEDMVRRDPTTPWLRAALGKTIEDAGGTGGEALLAEAIQSSTDYADLFPMAAMLHTMRKPALAAVAYDRAYTDFLARGRDPRLMTTLLPGLVLFAPFGRNPDALDDDERFGRLEHFYQLMPAIEGTERAWPALSRYFERRGNAEAARQWRERADQSRSSSLNLASLDLQVAADQIALATYGAGLAGILLVGTLYFRYAPQRRLQMAAAARLHQRLPSRLATMQYWSASERASILAIAVIGWLCFGAWWGVIRVVMEGFTGPVHIGDISGQDDIDFLRNRPASPERDLLLAISHHTSSNLAEAERLYRALPQFAESWNNLGVMLTNQGRTDEARRAFASALERDPSLAEAVLNTGGGARTLAARVHERYAPATPMIALPGRHHFLDVYGGSYWTGRYWRAAIGPLEALRARESAQEWGLPPLPIFFGVVTLSVLAVGLVCWLVPFRVATLPPGRTGRMLDFIVPGVSRWWRWAGPPLLLVWSVCVVIWFVGWISFSPYVITGIAQPGILRAFGLPLDATSWIDRPFEDIEPPMAVIASLAALMPVANLALIRWRSRSVQSS